MRLRGEGLETGEETEDAALLQKQGDAHETAHLEKLKVVGKTVLEIPRGDMASEAQATQEALSQDIEVLFQVAFLSETWDPYAG